MYFKEIIREVDAEGFPFEVELNLLGQDEQGRDRPVWVKWVNAHGREVFTNIQLRLTEPATLTMRYRPDIRADMVVYRRGDPNPFEIVGINDVLERHRWLEVTVQRKVAAR